jgi:hypothetical protein
MPRIEIVIKDDDGNVVSTQQHELNVQSGSFHDVEGAVEEWRKRVLPGIELDILRQQQERLKAEKRGS